MTRPWTRPRSESISAKGTLLICYFHQYQPTLGDRKTFNISVLKLFVEKQDFSNMIFEKALR